MTAEADPFYVRDTIATLRADEGDGPLAGHLAKLRVLKAQIEDGLQGDPPPLLQSIDQAVARIKAGLYHLCVKCGRRIGESRIRTESPWIVTCTSCGGHRS